MLSEKERTFNLQDILEILKTVKYDCMGFPMLMTVWSDSFKRWEILFRNPTFTNPEIHDKNILKCAYKMLCWCAENGKLELKK